MPTEAYIKWMRCERKRRYTQRNANRAIKRQKKRIRLIAYECPYCGYYHLAKERRKQP